MNEVQIFFIYDKQFCNSEEDDPSDAIVYFYPLEISESFRCALCSQLMGMVQFFSTSFSEPIFIHLKKNKFALKGLGNFTMFLGGNIEMPDSVLKRQLNSLHDVFQFYHHSINSVQELFNSSRSDFLNEMDKIWQYYLPVSQYYGNTVLLTFDILPSLNLPKTGGNIFRRASQVLCSCQSQPGVIAGCIFSQNQLLYSCFPPEILKFLFFISSDNFQLPAEKAVISKPLPAGVQIVYIYLTSDSLRHILNFKKDRSFPGNDYHEVKSDDEIIEGLFGGDSFKSSDNDEIMQAIKLEKQFASSGDSCLAEEDTDSDSGRISKKICSEANTEQPRKTHIENEKAKLCKFCLYIQGDSDTQLFLLGDQSLSLNSKVIDSIWKIGHSKLLDLEIDIKCMTENFPKKVSSDNYLYLQFDCLWKSVKVGKTIEAYPAHLAEQLFNRTVQILHETMSENPSLQEGSLMFGDSVIYGHKLGSLETYFQEMIKLSPTNNPPRNTVAVGNISSSAKRKLEKEHGIILL